MKTISLIRKSVSNFPKTALLTGVGMAMSLFSSAQMSGSYTIDQGTAASSTNFQNFTSAVQALKGQTRSDGGPALGTGVNGAVTITVASGSGPYNEQVTLNSINGASSSNTITFDGNNEWMISAGSAGSMFNLDGADHIILTNIKLKSTQTTYSNGIWLHNAADNNIIRNCEIDMTSNMGSANGISISTSTTGASYGANIGSNNIIEENTITGGTNSTSVYCGIYSGNNTSGTQTIIRNNQIFSPGYYGIFTYWEPNPLISGNTIIGTGKNTQFYGITAQNSMNAVITGNYISTSNAGSTNQPFIVQSRGIYTYSSFSNSTLEISNNIIVLETSKAVISSSQGIYTNNYYGISSIIHNTIIINKFNSANYLDVSGLYANTNPGSTVHVLNNIFDMQSLSNVNGNIYCMYLSTHGSLHSNGNVFGISPQYNIWCTGGYYQNQSIQYSNLSQWQSAFGKDANSLQTNPSYANIAGGDYTPTTNSIDGIGISTTVTTDYSGTTRNSSNPDPGAIEFGSGMVSSLTAIAKDTTLYLNASGTVSINASDLDNGSLAGSSATFNLSKSSFDCGNIGANQVVFSIVDGSQTAYDTVTVTVVDALAPVVNTQNITVTLANGVASITANDVNNGSSDNCGISSMSVTPNNWTCNDIGNHTVTLTVNDANGNSASGTATVTVSGAVPSASISASPSNNTYTGAASNQMFIGYGAQSMNLTCSANGGTGFSYSWSGSYLSSSTGSTNVFTPTASGNYTLYCTVTNANGCETTSSITICVMDIRSNNNANNQKVYLCHNGNTLSISVNAVGSHLNNHSNDKLGQCSWSCNSLKKEAAGEMFVSGDLELIVYPNPSNGVFKFTLESESDESIDIRIYDAAGKLVLSKTGGYSHEEIHVDASALASGIYTAVVSQGDFIQTVKLTKTN